MILDRELMFSNEVDIGVTEYSDVIDFKAGGDAIGQELTIRAVVTQDFAGTGSLTLAIQTSTDNRNWEDVIVSPTRPAAVLKAGREILCIRVPKGLERYARIEYSVSGAIAAGKITAFMSKEL